MGWQHSSKRGPQSLVPKHKESSSRWFFQGSLTNFQLAGGFKRTRIKSADFGGAADIQRHHLRSPRRRWRRCGRLSATSRGIGRHNASLGAEKTIADGDENVRYRQRRGKAAISIIRRTRVNKAACSVSVRARRFRSCKAHQGNKALPWTKARLRTAVKSLRFVAATRARPARSRARGAPSVTVALAAESADPRRFRHRQSAPVRDPAYHAKPAIRSHRRAGGGPPPSLRRRYQLDIVYEDDDIIVIDKPKGLVVHPAAGHETGTLVNALIAHCGISLSGIGGVRRPGIVHRLDKDTTGLMVAAKNDRAHKSLTEQFADHGRTGAMRRGYMAFAWGVPNRQRGTVDAPIDRHPFAREKMAVRDSGREAITTGNPGILQRARRQAAAALLACQLETGRTHQIRVHLAHINHPLMGDSVYGPHFKTKASHLGPESQKALAALGRQALHAYLLALEHPRNGAVLEWISDLPEDLARLRDSLRATQ